MSLSRVIEVSFNGGSIAYVKADTAYFYNNGILFKPTDIDLPASYQVHWADSPQASSTLETIGTAEGAPIPDDLWGRSRVIYGWIYLHPTNDSGITAYEVRIYKNVRAGLPDGTEPTPAEQSTIDQLISALNSAVDQTGEDVESAEQSARSAESAKTAAESARDTAGEYANDAESSAASASTSASQASTSATASAQSASQSAQIKADVEGMVDDAQGYASASAQSASASANSASDAQGYANSASASAQSASGYASSAQTSANTASTKATEASTSAQTASQKATEATQSATNASQSAQTAEQAKTASQTAQGLAESARDTAVSAKNDAEQAKTDAESAKADAESARDEAQQAVASISGALAEKAPVITDPASGAIASFSDGADDLPLKSLVIDINPIQDLSHGDPSPENICPISGWTQIDVNHSGADMTNPTTLTIDLGQTVYGGKLDVLSGVVTVDRAMVDLGTLNYSRYSPTLTNIPVFYSAVNGIKPSSGGLCKSSAYTCKYWSSLEIRIDYTIEVHPTLQYIYIADSRYETVADFKNAMSGVQLVYPLATPLTIQLTPQQINSLLGVNNIWADSGDTEAVYRADTKLFIERLTAPDSADMIADANITSGQYFMVGNSLYKATANIANGRQIIVGTNCIRKSLSEALNEINA